jgi:hypothetical protein
MVEGSPKIQPVSAAEKPSIRKDETVNSKPSPASPKIESRVEKPQEIFTEKEANTANTKESKAMPQVDSHPATESDVTRPQTSTVVEPTVPEDVRSRLRKYRSEQQKHSTAETIAEIEEIKQLDKASSNVQPTSKKSQLGNEKETVQESSKSADSHSIHKAAGAPGAALHDSEFSSISDKTSSISNRVSRQDEPHPSEDPVPLAESAQASKPDTSFSGTVTAYKVLFLEEENGLGREERLHVDSFEVPGIPHTDETTKSIPFTVQLMCMNRPSQWLKPICGLLSNGYQPVSARRGRVVLRKGSSPSQVDAPHTKAFYAYKVFSMEQNAFGDDEQLVTGSFVLSTDTLTQEREVSISKLVNALDKPTKFLRHMSPFINSGYKPIITGTNTFENSVVLRKVCDRQELEQLRQSLAEDGVDLSIYSDAAMNKDANSKAASVINDSSKTDTSGSSTGHNEGQQSTDATGKRTRWPRNVWIVARRIVGYGICVPFTLLSGFYYFSDHNRYRTSKLTIMPTFPESAREDDPSE